MTGERQVWSIFDNCLVPESYWRWVSGYAGMAPVAQRTEHPASNREDVGSIPVGGIPDQVAKVAAGFDGPGRRMARRNKEF